jgi:hypothetical protein
MPGFITAQIYQQVKTGHRNIITGQFKNPWPDKGLNCSALIFWHFIRKFAGK